MPTRDDVLRTETFNDAPDIMRRVFYTLQRKPEHQNHRNSKAVALIVDHLVQKHLMTADELDELLLSCLG